jgi:uncharacterized protein DUF6247
MPADLVRDENPTSPAVILRALPERERAEFLRQYREARGAARGPAGYRRLRHLLHVWRLIVIATRQPGYVGDMERMRGGIALTMPAEEIIPGWPDRLAVARASGP